MSHPLTAGIFPNGTLAGGFRVEVVVVYNNLLVTLVTQKCFVNNGLADKTSTEPGLGWKHGR